MLFRSRRDIIAGTCFESPRPPETVKPQVPQQPPAAASVEAKPPLPAVTPQAPPWLRGEKVLLKIEPIYGAGNSTMNSLRDRLMENPYIKVVEDDFFDRLLRGEL